MRIGEEFETYRSFLFALAYRMLGSASEAEDIVQDTYIHCATASHDDMHATKASLGTVTARLCLDYLESVQVERAQYLGPWLPEPVLTSEPETAPLTAVAQRESISLAFLMLLERLTPVERAVFLLHDVFEYSDEEIAEVVDQSPANCRHLGQQAVERLGQRQPRWMLDPDRERGVTERFLVACRSGDQHALLDLLARDVTVWSDGGSKAVAARRPVQGQDTVGRFLLGVMRTFSPTMTATHEEINAGPALLLWEGGELTAVVAFDLVGGTIQALHLILNPAKLMYLRHQLRVR